MYGIEELLKIRIRMIETEINRKPRELKVAVLEFEVMQLTEKLKRLNNKGEIK